MTTRRQLIQGAAAAGVLGLAPLAARAQTRVETLRIIVGFPPGAPPTPSPGGSATSCVAPTPTRSSSTTSPARAGSWGS